MDTVVRVASGVEVDVKLDFTEQDENRSFKKDDLITLKKGKQVLNGKEALAYARQIFGCGSFVRSKLKAFIFVSSNIRA